MKIKVSEGEFVWPTANTSNESIGFAFPPPTTVSPQFCSLFGPNSSHPISSSSNMNPKPGFSFTKSPTPFSKHHKPKSPFEPKPKSPSISYSTSVDQKPNNPSEHFRTELPKFGSPYIPGSFEFKSEPIDFTFKSNFANQLSPKNVDSKPNFPGPNFTEQSFTFKGFSFNSKPTNPFDENPKPNTFGASSTLPQAFPPNSSHFSASGTLHGHLSDEVSASKSGIWTQTQPWSQVKKAYEPTLVEIENQNIGQYMQSISAMPFNKNDSHEEIRFKDYQQGYNCIGNNKSSEDSNKSLEDLNKRLEDSNKSSEDLNKRLEDSNKSSEDSNKSLEDLNKSSEDSNGVTIIEWKNGLALVVPLPRFCSCPKPNIEIVSVRKS